MPASWWSASSDGAEPKCPRRAASTARGRSTGARCPASGYLDQSGTRDAVGEFARVGQGRRGVLTSADDEGRRGDPVQLIAKIESGEGFAARGIGDRVSRTLIGDQCRQGFATRIGGSEPPVGRRRGQESGALAADLRGPLTPGPAGRRSRPRSRSARAKRSARDGGRQGGRPRLRRSRCPRRRSAPSPSWSARARTRSASSAMVVCSPTSEGGEAAVPGEVPADHPVVACQGFDLAVPYGHRGAEGRAQHQRRCVRRTVDHEVRHRVHEWFLSEGDGDEARSAARIRARSTSSAAAPR